MASRSAGGGKPVERALNVLALLKSSRVPLTLDAITNEVPGYPDEAVARRAMFERDKRLLREAGVVLHVTVQDDNTSAYSVDANDLEVHLDLERDERHALGVALAAVHLGVGQGRSAAGWLADDARADVAAPIAVLGGREGLRTLYAASVERAPALFHYHGERRDVVVERLAAKDGYWYVLGFDRTRGDRRTFRVDRIEGDVELGERGSALAPPGPVAEVPSDPWGFGADAPVEVDVRIDAVRALAVRREVGADRVVAEGDDGSITVRLRVANPEALRSWALGLLDHAEVLAPPPVRALVVGWLEAVAGGQA